jgi:hypothetical protein
MARARLRAASAAAIGVPLVKRRDLGQPRRLELIEAERGAVDDVDPTQQRQLDGIRDVRAQADCLSSAVAGQPANLGAVAEVDGHQRRMCGQH